MSPQFRERLSANEELMRDSYRGGLEKVVKPPRRPMKMNARESAVKMPRVSDR